MKRKILTYLRVLVLNINILNFFKFQLKINQKDIFGSKFKVLYVLNETLQFHKFEGADIKHESSFLKLQPKNTQ